MFLLYYTPCGLRGHCTTNTVHDNGEYPLLLQGGFSTVGTHADVVLYPLRFEGVLYNEHSAWQWRIPPYLALPGFGQVSLVRLGIINMLPGNTKWGGILRFFTRRSLAFHPLQSTEKTETKGASSLFRSAGGLLRNYQKVTSTESDFYYLFKQRV